MNEPDDPAEAELVLDLLLALASLCLVEAHLRAVAEMIRSCEPPLVQEPPGPPDPQGPGGGRIPESAPFQAEPPRAARFDKTFRFPGFPHRSHDMRRHRGSKKP
jgi:hypothetical protein